MLRAEKPVTVRSPKRRFQSRLRAPRAACLLCQVLWPFVVQHRHLSSDFAPSDVPNPNHFIRGPRAFEATTLHPERRCFPLPSRTLESDVDASLQFPPFL
jgi:hypothetical protein